MAMLRPRSLTRTVMACAALSFAVLIAEPSVEARDLSLNVNPDTGVFTINGWSRRVADTGTVFYTCEDQACGKGSTVSMRKQPQLIAPDADAVRRNEMRTSETLRERLQGKIDRIDVGEPSVTRDQSFSVGEISRTIVPIAGVDAGIQAYWKTGYVTSKSAMYTISSSADSRALSDENYDMFKFALMLSGAKNTPAPK